jgi:HAD superfamily phosphoserine phosphatase-like hydrolase
VGRFKLITFDVDGTLLRGASWKFITEKINKYEEYAKVVKRFLRGEISELDSHRALIPLIKELPLPDVYSILDQAPKIQNIPEAVSAFKRHGLKVGTLSLTPFSGYFMKYGFDQSICNIARVKEGKILGLVQEPLRDKVEGLTSYCKRTDIKLQECIHVGDSLTDVETFKKVGLSIALNSRRPEVRKLAHLSLDTENLLEVYESIKESLNQPSTTKS